MRQEACSDCGWRRQTYQMSKCGCSWARLLAQRPALMAALMASSSALNPFLPCTRHTELVLSSMPVSASPIVTRVELTHLALFCCNPLGTVAHTCDALFLSSVKHCCSQVSSTGKGRGVLSISAPSAPQFHKTYPANNLQHTPER